MNKSLSYDPMSFKWLIGKHGGISDGTFNWVGPKKRTKSLFLKFSLLVENLKDCDLGHLFEDETKLKKFYKITQPSVDGIKRLL